MSSEYDDLLNLPHHTSAVQPAMSMQNRAAQFAPFAALVGYDALIQETARLTDQKVELDESVKAELNEKLRLLLETICGTGIRVSELKYITAEAVYQGEAVIRLKGKIRIVLISGKLKKALKKYLKKRKILSGSVFITKNGNPLDRSNIWKMMKALCKDAGVASQKVFPHNLRHLFARCFYRLDKDIARLADILGHSSINTTRLYVMSSDYEPRKRMDALGLVI